MGFRLVAGCVLTWSLAWLPALAQSGPLPADEAARQAIVPAGFVVTPFAAEPDVVQPIAFTFDDRGRLWVVECLSYPNFTKDGAGRDRVTIFSDTDGDGRMDDRRVFLDQGANLSGIEWGYGGVWLCSSPNLIFVPDRNRDDVPDGPAEIVLDGWDVTARHNVFNSLIWGPDGWLYGANGILSNSRVGPPGAADADRTSLNCGVWRYHPVSKRFEAVAHGTTNPWGLDFDDHGEMFITNCVIEHLFHVTPGAHFKRMFGQDIAPHSYSLISSCADHLHWAGGFWDTEGVDKPENDAFGGGHAHSGAMIYLGDNWPAKYRNGVFSLNIHGRRLNHDRLEPHGSGVTAKHEPDAFRSADPWFRGVAVKQGPDGAVYIADWSDTGECHDYEEIERDNGRIYKIAYGKPKPLAPFDLAVLSDADLVELQNHANDWQVRHARRLLAERAAAGLLAADARPKLTRLSKAKSGAARRLRALWALHATGGIERSMLDDRDDRVRAWAVRLLVDDRALSPDLTKKLRDMARTEAAPLVRRELASALPYFSLRGAYAVSLGLTAREEDRDDPNLPFLVWYGIERHVAAHPAAALALLVESKWPLVRNHAARRLALAGELATLVEALQKIEGAAAQRDVLAGLVEALQGRRDVPLPAGWDRVGARLQGSSDLGVRQLALQAAIQFGDAQAAADARAAVLDGSGERNFRERCLSILVQQKLPGLAALLQQLLADKALRGAAIRGLAACDEADSPQRLLELYAALSAAEKADVIATLASRKAYAMALVEAIEGERVPRGDVSPFVARQLTALNDVELVERFTKAWGALRPASEAKAQLKAEYKQRLSPADLAAADISGGRRVFAKQCAACHKMFDAGGRIGPELTGAQRGNLDYVLDNVLDPSAVVPRDFQSTNFQTTDGRLVAGIVRQENDAAVTVQTPNDVVVLSKGDIEIREPSTVSMMPEGLFVNLKPNEIRDLVAYLASPSQAPLQEGE